MLQKYKTKREEGFTIIEVLIVLAIAGLIILIVFLAVPALQRNSRNTSRRNDISKVGGSVQEILNNNNGRVDSVTSDAINAAIGANLSYYDFTANAPSVTDTAGNNDTGVETIVVVSNARCEGSNTTDTDASPRQFAIMYSVESGTAGTETHVCQDV